MKSNILKKIIKISFIIIIVLLIGLWVLTPFYFILYNSFNSNLARFFVSNNDDNEGFRPPSFTLRGYINALKNKDVIRAFINSLIVCIATTFFSILISLFAAYALSRIKFKWKKTYEIGLYTTQMFPSVALIIPYFVLFVFIRRYLHIPMKNTYHGLIITYTSFSLPFCILMMRNYFLSVPRIFDEQAQIDGCSKFQIIFRVLIPMSLPAIITVAVYSFVMAWNEIIFTSLLVDPELRTISVLLISPRFITFAEYFATSILVIIPVVVIFTILQKQLVKGLGRGIIKF